MKIASPCSRPTLGISPTAVILPYVVIGCLFFLAVSFISAQEVVKPAVPVSPPERFIPKRISVETTVLVFMTDEGATVLRRTLVSVALVPEDGVQTPPFFFGEKTDFEPILKICKHFLVRDGADGTRIVQGVNVEGKVVYERLLTPPRPPKEEKHEEGGCPVYNT